ncbi:hypothetical protein PRK78_005474 [Emydomyces testavorans]|uniref:Uncharacterized protein n=1 Tax=Emydomyces testavorans TaxID=2070801 RepID=A0AAF0DLS9_9EURO|nr:hypothetical protein PRK78_005474 [Emydomyces testavorans]
MPLTSRSRAKHGASLLPAASLEGLERFVHPHQTQPVEQRDSWKFKPLPALPRAISGESSRPLRNFERNSRNGIYGSVPHDASPSTSHNSVGRSLRDQYQGGTAGRRTPLANSSEQYHQSIIGHQSRWIARQTSASGLSHGQSWAESDSCREKEWPCVPEVDDGQGSQHSNDGRPKTPTITRPSTAKSIDSIDPSLIPRPLGIEATLAKDSGEVRKAREKTPISPVEHSDPEICLCHSPHPRHHRVASVSRLSSVLRGDLPRWSTTTPRERVSLPTVTQHEDEDAQQTAAPNELQEKDTNGNKGQDSDEQFVARENPNCTKLYSFYTSASTSMLVKEGRESEDSDLSDTERPRTPYHSPRQSRSTSLPPPLPAASLHPRHPRHQKQLAIPPTDYQKYGPQIWTKDKSKTTLKDKDEKKEKQKQKVKVKEKGKDKDKDGTKRGRMSTISRYLRKLLPKAFSSEPLANSSPPDPNPPPSPLPPPPRLTAARSSTSSLHKTSTAPAGPSAPYEKYTNGQHHDHYDAHTAPSKLNHTASLDDWGRIRHARGRRDRETASLNMAREKVGGGKRNRLRKEDEGKGKGRPKPAEVRDDNGMYWF